MLKRYLAACLLAAGVVVLVGVSQQPVQADGCTVAAVCTVTPERSWCVEMIVCW